MNIEQIKIEQIKQEAEKRYPYEVEDLIYGHTRRTGRYEEYEAFVKGAQFAQTQFAQKEDFESKKEDFESIELIKSERKRQLQEGYTNEHDDCETSNQLSNAAIVYACAEQSRDQVTNFWQWDVKSWKPASEDTIDGRIRNLTKAGALICAEIDRLERLKIK